MATITHAGGPSAAVRANLPFIIGASSVGTLIEWYDFYIYGVLAAVFAQCAIGLQGARYQRARPVLVQPQAYPRRLGHEASRSISSPSKAPEAR